MKKLLPLPLTTQKEELMKKSRSITLRENSLKKLPVVLRAS